MEFRYIISNNSIPFYYDPLNYDLNFKIHRMVNKYGNKIVFKVILCRELFGELHNPLHKLPDLSVCVCACAWLYFLLLKPTILINYLTRILLLFWPKLLKTFTTTNYSHKCAIYSKTLMPCLTLCFLSSILKRWGTSNHQPHYAV